MTDDFKAWVAQTVTAGEPHLLSPGNRVHLAAVRYPVGLTAEQAVKVARRILACAGVPPDAILLPPGPDAVVGGDAC